jgi:hypothetical protein
MVFMLRQFLFGGAVSVCNIAVHALSRQVVVRIARTMGAKSYFIRTLFWLG